VTAVSYPQAGNSGGGFDGFQNDLNGETGAPDYREKQLLP
jgi:hypothetical protein